MGRELSSKQRGSGTKFRGCGLGIERGVANSGNCSDSEDLGARALAVDGGPRRGRQGQGRERHPQDVRGLIYDGIDKQMGHGGTQADAREDGRSTNCNSTHARLSS